MITKEEAEKYKSDLELDLFKETSAKTGFNTEELFVQAAKLLYTDYSKYKIVKTKREGEILKPETKEVEEKNKEVEKKNVHGGKQKLRRNSKRSQ